MNATKLFGQAGEIAIPPLKVDINGIYILTIKSNKKWVPKKMIDDPDVYM